MYLHRLALTLSKVSIGIGVAIVIISVADGINESRIEWKYLFVGLFIMAINTAYVLKALKNKDSGDIK